MNEYLTALTAAGTTIALGAVMIARAWTVQPARHRAPHKLPPETDLIGPPSAYTTVDPNADTHAFGVVRTGFGWCEPCAQTTAGVITRNGFRCGEYYRHPAGGGC
ncbi:hypothetical protein O3S80_04130 [Streptomyces sp. Lzd4kr]|nr:hypothetical protein [Streptomyces sp. Lzd4kr]